MNFKRRLASKNLEANLTSGVATGWKKAKKPFLVSWFCGSKQKMGRFVFSIILENMNLQFIKMYNMDNNYTISLINATPIYVSPMYDI